MELNKAEV